MAKMPLELPQAKQNRGPKPGREHICKLLKVNMKFIHYHAENHLRLLQINKTSVIT